FIYMGNDLLESRPADDRGIAGLLYAPLPKSSLLGVLMPSLNYHLAKKYKRSTNVWLADNLHFREQSVLEQFKKLDIGKLPLVLARNDRKGGGRKCYQAMSKLDLGDFYRMLTHPDMGLFRTYILVDAITRFCHPEINRSVVQTGQYTLRMIDRMNDLARENNIGFSVVIVPQGFDVDDRMWSQWKILSDYRKIHKYALAASGLKQKLRERDIHVVDLYPAFRSKRGTYLNVDGHWSGFGNELAAKEIAEEITGLDID
ncbi:MAG TPA: hypothetical protein ENK49_14580, partial [Gammaproteobacteria bacterium]|nr:hypothetical protein [Gammaproteobacteria bacterium]